MTNLCQSIVTKYKNNLNASVVKRCIKMSSSCGYMIILYIFILLIKYTYLIIIEHKKSHNVRLKSRNHKS